MAAVPSINLDFPADTLEAIADAVVEKLAARSTAEAASPYLTAAEAAEYIRAPISRIYDLTHRNALPVIKEGSRSLYRRADLDALLVTENRR